MVDLSFLFDMAEELKNRKKVNELYRQLRDIIIPESENEKYQEMFYGVKTGLEILKKYIVKMAEEVKSEKK